MMRHHYSHITTLSLELVKVFGLHQLEITVKHMFTYSCLSITCRREFSSVLVCRGIALRVDVIKYSYLTLSFNKMSRYLASCLLIIYACRVGNVETYQVNVCKLFIFKYSSILK